MTTKDNMKPNQPETAVAIVPKHEIVHHAPIDIEAMFKYAIDKGANLDGLMNVRRELNAERSKKEYDSALSAFQAECPVIIKKVKGATGAYKFAPLDEIMPVVQPILSRHGFSFSITSEVELKWIKALCKVTHAGGHFEISEFKVPTDERNTMMTDPQRYAGSLTFAKRYAFCNAFGIMTGDEDRDAARQKSKSVSAKVATPATLQWFLEQTKLIHKQLIAYAIDKALIMPNQSLEDWPLEKCPTSKTELEELKKEVQDHA